MFLRQTMAALALIANPPYFKKGLVYIKKCTSMKDCYKCRVQGTSQPPLFSSAGSFILFRVTLLYVTDISFKLRREGLIG